MHSFTVIHESRDLKQARLYGQYVDLLRIHARYSLINTYETLTLLTKFVNRKLQSMFVCILQLLTMKICKKVHFRRLFVHFSILLKIDEKSLWRICTKTFVDFCKVWTHYLFEMCYYTKCKNPPIHYI